MTAVAWGNADMAAMISSEVTIFMLAQLFGKLYARSKSAKRASVLLPDSFLHRVHVSLNAETL